ncbi:hypothetical protein ABID16_003456 [Rhizobium aquaticum]|uniref:Uncharacterized protein n=1 Tax=Rhizobium aquaticum TaxID=1549636 RepID=A0ABV2J308_9HYPH
MHSHATPPRATSDRVSLLQHSALFRVGLAAIALGGLWLAIAWAMSLS